MDGIHLGSGRLRNASRRRGARVGLAAITIATLVVGLGAPVMATDPRLEDSPVTEFYVPKPNHGAIEQIARLRAAGRSADAALISAMIDTPSAVWFTKGTPASVEQDVRATVKRAAGKKTVPVLVAYNIPFRDCAQFSAGGATTTDEYLAWMDGFASGIGDARAIVILEPDGLGIIPYYRQFGTGAMEWCQPPDANAQTAAADRFLQLNAAVDRLNEQPGVSAYLDGTHSRWLGSGDAAHRLVQAGVQRAAGFYVNVSNFQRTEELEKYGSWISGCIAFANSAEEGGWRLGHYDWCASQYFPANVDDFSTWGQTDAWYAANLGTATATTRFVVDTSRNGVGRWIPPAGHPAGDPQDWCNPPDRGLGLRPSADTGHPLIDAWLWVKIPGESDGQCNRWAPPGSPDPVRGIVDPPAGEWFPDLALELARNAVSGD
jgi:endoglucanase